MNVRPTTADSSSHVLLSTATHSAVEQHPHDQRLDERSPYRTGIIAPLWWAAPGASEGVTTAANRVG